MKSWWPIWTVDWFVCTSIVATLTLVGLVPGPRPAQAQNLERARQAFVDSSLAAERALERALEQAPPEARRDLEMALNEIRASRQRTVTELASLGSQPDEFGRARARSAVDLGTQTHQLVLQELVDKVPPEARPAIERALEVSRTGRETALGALTGESAPGPAGVGPALGASGGPPPGVRAGPPIGTVPGAPVGIRSGPPAGIRGGPPAGIRGR